jgi:hypothetical protein
LRENGIWHTALPGPSSARIQQFNRRAWIISGQVGTDFGQPVINIPGGHADFVKQWQTRNIDAQEVQPGPAQHSQVGTDNFGVRAAALFISSNSLNFSAWISANSGTDKIPRGILPNFVHSCRPV